MSALSVGDRAVEKKRKQDESRAARDEIKALKKGKMEAQAAAAAAAQEFLVSKGVQ